MNDNQFLRKLQLTVSSAIEVIDLSQFRIHFMVNVADVESPNTLVARVYNLAAETVSTITRAAEFNGVQLQAGYQQGSNYGTIFNGTIKQFRVGKENNKDTYLDILAADGDIFYNQAVVNQSFVAGATPSQMAQAAASVGQQGQQQATAIASQLQGVDAAHVPNIRGAVLFGMARVHLSNIATKLDCSWSIQNGQIQMLPFTSYLPGEAVEINTMTGLIGLPEQTDGGIRIQCLLNAKLRIGGLVKLNNDEIVQLMQQNPNAAPIPYDQWTGFQYNTPLAPNGIYRILVVEHVGDSRGKEWYSNLVCLATDLSAAAPVANH